MGELDRGSDRDKPSEPAAFGEASSRGGELRLVVETRTRGEAYADLRQSAESGWDRSRRFDAPRSELAGFRAERAGLPGVSSEEASRYVERHRAGRPWLKTAERASPEALRIIVAADLSGGHGHIRHEGWVMEQASMRRVAYLEDPAQLDPDKRSRGIDGLRPGGRHHICADRASRITDPDAFATALARGAGHPAVRAALSTPYDRGSRPDPVWLPITDMLGKDGHELCTGWQLEPIDGSIDVARNNRRAWRTAMAEGRQPDAPEPAARPIPTFEGGSMVFVIGHNRQRNGYEIATLFPQPPAHDLPVRLAGRHRRTRKAFMDQPYWIRHPDGPFTTLIRIATTYLHPEADDLESLQQLAKRADRPEMRTFKSELRQAIIQPDQVPRDEISNHVQYDDGSPEKFLLRLWRDLYGDEPIGASG